VFARQPCDPILSSQDVGQWLCVPPFRVVCLYQAWTLTVNDVCVTCISALGRVHAPCQQGASGAEGLAGRAGARCRAHARGAGGGEMCRGRGKNCWAGGPGGPAGPHPAGDYDACRDIPPARILLEVSHGRDLHVRCGVGCAEEDGNGVSHNGRSDGAVGGGIMAE
jgi:hypothetical protein